MASFDQMLSGSTTAVAPTAPTTTGTMVGGGQSTRPGTDIGNQPDSIAGLTAPSAVPQQIAQDVMRSKDPFELAQNIAGGGVVTRDINRMLSPVYAEYDPQRYQADPRLFQMGQGTQVDPLTFQRRYFGAEARPGIDPTTQMQQQALIAALQQQQQPGPSAAELQLQQGLQQQQQQALSTAAAQRGTNPGLALRQAQQQQTEAGLGVQQQAAVLRAQETAQAQQLALQQQGLLGQTIAGARGQDIGLRAQDIGMRGQDIQQLQQQRAMNDQMTRFYEQQGLSRDQAQLQANIAMAQLEAQSVQQQQALAAQIAMANAQAAQRAQAGAIGMVGGLVGGLVGGPMGAAAGAGAGGAGGTYSL